MQSAFEIQDVTVRFAEHIALENVSVRVDVGERVAIVGPSGAGKTTLLRLLNAAISPTAGQVSTFGRRLSQTKGKELRRLQSDVGFVHQQFNLVPNLRVIQNVIAGRLGKLSLLAGVRAMLIPSRPQITAVYELLRQVGIEEKLYQRTDTLSGGQLQRVAIARALFQQPQAVLADEPISSVDPARARDTLELLRRVTAGATLCVTLHRLDLAREFFPRLIGLRAGRIAFDKPTSEVTNADFDSLYQLESRQSQAAQTSQDSRLDSESAEQP